MGQFQERSWESRFATGFSRASDRSGTFQAFIPAALMARHFLFESETAADVSEAESAVTKLDLSATTRSNTEALAPLLLRAESVASSRIEGLEISAQRLLRYGAARAQGDAATDETAEEILGNIDAMSLAVAGDGDITLDRIFAVHQQLMAPTKLAASGGRVRTEQNWVGGTSFSPFGAAFVPPPPENVSALLADLVTFCNTDSLPAVAQAAIAHAQFETIHPFTDGNGRTGRALIHMILRRRGLTSRTLLPVSLVLATHAKSYVFALQSLRFEGDPNSSAGQQLMNAWIAMFAGACRRAAADAQSFELQIERIATDWEARLAHLRADAAALRLIRILPGMPLLTPRSAEKALGATYNTANTAIEVLVDANILTSTRTGRRNRGYEAREIIDAFTSFERQLASPVGDTKMVPPVRYVPRRVDR